MKNYKEINRDEFMHFFRDDEKLNELTPDDRIEILNKQAVVDKDSIIKTPASGIIFNKLNNF